MTLANSSGLVMLASLTDKHLVPGRRMRLQSPCNCQESPVLSRAQANSLLETAITLESRQDSR